MVDRYNRKMMMMVSDLVAVTATVAILILQAAGLLQFWHLYVAVVIQGLGSSFQWPRTSSSSRYRLASSAVVWSPRR